MEGGGLQNALEAGRREPQHNFAESCDERSHPGQIVPPNLRPACQQAFGYRWEMEAWEISGARIASIPADASTEGSPSTVCTVKTLGGKEVLFRSAEALVRSREKAFTCTAASEACKAEAARWSRVNASRASSRKLPKLSCSPVNTSFGEFTRLTWAFLSQTRALCLGGWVSWAMPWHMVVLFTGSRNA